MTDATPTQPTGSGKWIWHKPLTRDVVTLGTLPDPRDARIAQLEAALRKIVSCCEHRELYANNKVRECYKLANAALMPSPEGDMTITHEAMNA